LIARNERQNVRPCLESFGEHVDQIVFVDTGSEDDSATEARRVAREHGWQDKLTLGRFKWCDDFAAARNYAASLATGDFHIWVDLDDRVIGAGHLPDLLDRLAQQPGVGWVEARYVSIGQVTSHPSFEASAVEEWRPRLFRAPVRWIGATYELPERTGEACRTEQIWWWHRKTRERGTRDLEIAKRWLKREPGNLRALGAALSESVGLGHLEEALAIGDEIQRQRKLDPDYRARCCALMAEVFRRLGRPEDAERYAMSSHRARPNDHASLVLAWVAVTRRSYQHALKWSQRVLSEPMALRQNKIEAGIFVAHAAHELSEWGLACDAAEYVLALLPRPLPGSTHAAYRDVLKEALPVWSRHVGSSTPAGIAIEELA
jgi:hypothetical protein